MTRDTMRLHMFLVKTVIFALSLLVAYQFWRGFRSSVDQFQKQGEETARVSVAFVEALFQVMGHLAKIDGRVSEDEIRAARLVMHRLGLTPAQVRRAIAWFDQGKQPGFELAANLRQARSQSVRSARERQMFVRLLLEVVLAKPSFKREERALIWTVCTELGIGRVELAQLEAMIRAQKGFKRSPAGDADAARLAAAYSALGVAADASNDDIKTSYRRLMNRNQLDKLSSSNPDDAAIAAAERRTREIRKAYELLKARRSIR